MAAKVVVLVITVVRGGILLWIAIRATEAMEGLAVEVFAATCPVTVVARWGALLGNALARTEDQPLSSFGLLSLHFARHRYRGHGGGDGQFDGGGAILLQLWYISVRQHTVTGIVRFWAVSLFSPVQSLTFER
ncbi:hypothetical protein GW17_00029187 [Ensete ventricosum]|nr:hypothetical protein GW17_00029187 [Ensete ventricosum]